MNLATPDVSLNRDEPLGCDFVRCARMAPVMERAGEFLGRALRRINRPDTALAWLESTWPSVMGRALAAHAHPVQCKDGCLELSSDGKAWQAQLESMGPELCARINRAWGGALVHEIKFVGAKSARRVAREIDNDHIPFIRRRR
jgi:predicted nucleic acid-binding Zn ribbon protein